ncbi:MAG: hypothetical protein JRD89_04435 [Deltaproteobacteria bacterium]|nr:hypothetical protein [Deltaproteobacteria bacterium]
MSEESRPPVAEAADLLEVLTYLQEKEESLSRHSNKLRKAVARIFGVFGDDRHCQICGQHYNAHFPRWKVHYADFYEYYHANDEQEVRMLAERDGITNIDRIEKVEEAAITDHKFVPKVYVSLSIRDERWFASERDESGEITDYYLAMRKGEMVIEAYDHEWLESTTIYPHNLSRKNLKKLVQSGRIPAFIRLMAERVTAEEREVRELAEIAEKLAKAVEG